MFFSFRKRGRGCGGPWPLYSHNCHPTGYRGWSGDLYQSVNNTRNAHTSADCVHFEPCGLDTPLQLGRNFKGKDLHKYCNCACKKIFNLEISAVDPDPLERIRTCFWVSRIQNLLYLLSFHHTGKKVRKTSISSNLQIYHFFLTFIHKN
jgi:hypothetical protein